MRPNFTPLRPFKMKENIRAEIKVTPKKTGCIKSIVKPNITAKNTKLTDG